MATLKWKDNTLHTRYVYFGDAACQVATLARPHLDDRLQLAEEVEEPGRVVDGGVPGPGARAHLHVKRETDQGRRRGHLGGRGGEGHIPTGLLNLLA